MKFQGGQGPFLSALGPFASNSGDSTAPTLSDPTDGTPTSDGCTDAGVTTNEGNGTLYWAVVTNGGSCTDAQLKAGSGGNIVPGIAGNQAVSGTGAQTIADITGLSASTTYQIKFLQRDAAGNDSAQASVGLTTTEVPDPYFANVTLLAINDNAANGTTTFVDQSSSPQTLTGQASIAYTNAQAPTGMTTSAAFVAASSQYISAPNNTGMDFDGDFTIEFMLRLNSTAADQSFISKFAGGQYAWLFQWQQASARFRQYNGNGSGGLGNQLFYSWSPSTATWYHVALTRDSGTNRVYVDGVQITSASDSANLTSTTSLNIGRNGDGGVQYVDGWMSNIRITKGVSRYPSGTSFTPPSLPMPTS